MLSAGGEDGGGRMNRVAKSVVEPANVASQGPPDVGDSRTLLKRRLVDTVVPAIALVSMSALTVTMIVVVVTTVAHGGWLTPPTYVSVDPWSSVYPGSADLRRDDILYPDVVTGRGLGQSSPSFDAEARVASGTGSFAAGMAE